MAIGVKRNETRGRPWAYVGPVAICAAQKKLGDSVPESYFPAMTQLWLNRDKFAPAKDIQALYNALPFGKVVCVVRKIGCISTDDDNGDDRTLTEAELACGNYEPHRFYYPTDCCRRLVNPVPIIGRQGPFNVSLVHEHRIRREICPQPESVACLWPDCETIGCPRKELDTLRAQE